MKRNSLLRQVFPLAVILALLVTGLLLGSSLTAAGERQEIHLTPIEKPLEGQSKSESLLDQPATADDTSGRSGYANPAATYCKKLGYQYDIREDEEGNQYGVCVFPDGSECDAWDFFRGECGDEYSYCARNGYDIETEVVDRGGYITECAVCVSRARDGTDATRVPVLELMQRNGEPLIETISCKADEDSRDDYLQSYSTINISERGDPPSAYDWRNIGGHSYIGPVRDQGDDCGSCYAFGACAAAESVYNIAEGLTDGGCSDFSESFIMWCLGGLSEYTPHFYGCTGSDYYYMELTALTDEGVCSESDFPYQTWDPGSCTHWDDPRTVFSSWSRISCNDVDAIKSAILNYGVVDVAVMTSYNFDTYGGGIYSDSMTTCYGSPCWMTPTNHIVSLVGWGHDAVEGDYWILRNSWGASWGEGGYMRIALTSARVACEATYISGVASTPTPTPTPTPAPGWVGIMSEDFEGAFPGSWQLGGNPTWGEDISNPHTGTYSAWCAKGGTAGVDPPSDYLNDMYAWMTYGPFDLSDATAAELNFWYWNKSEYGCDYFRSGASIDGDWFYYHYSQRHSGDSGGWQYESFDLTNVATLGNICGQPQVWIAFWFTSDGSGTDEGAFVDDIVLRKTSGALAPPVVTTESATGVAACLATLNGSLDSLGDYTTVNVSFKWGTTSGALDQETAPQEMTSTGAFTAALEDLEPDTTYYFSAKATGSVTVYGDELSFTTETIPPTVTTNPATDISADSATLNGNLTAMGTASSVEVSFEWGDTPAYGNETPAQTMTAPAAFSGNLTGLEPNTTYYFRAKVVGDGVSYGNNTTFETYALLQISLKAGWNMVSVPVTPSDNSVGAVFPGVTAIYTWDPVNKSYTVPATIEPDKGYLVAVTEDMTITVSGVPVTTWTNGITAGWNMIGSVFTDASIVDPNDDPDGSVESFAYWWDPVGKNYVFTIDIEPGKAYLVAATQDCTLTLLSP